MRKRATEILQSMTLSEKVGQMFVARYPEDGREEAVCEYALGGFTWYAKDFENETPHSIRRTISEYQKMAKVPLFMAVDEEGGRVSRVSIYPQFRHERFKYPSELYAEGGIEACAEDAAQKAKFLLDLGLNLNFAPVCDMTYSPDNYIYHRTLGEDVETTCRYISAVVKAMNEASICSSIKHFPGYGDNVDTHTSIAHDNRPIEDFLNADIFPFKAGIDADAPIIMVAHNIVSAMDPDSPASLSPKVHRIIREDLKFDGVIMTDSLDMGGITQFVGEDSAAVRAVVSGNDFLCCSSYKVQIPAVIEAVLDGRISEERIDSSVMKLLMLKLRFGIIK